MPSFRVTIRFGSPRMQYHVLDLTANSLREAMRLAAEEFPEAAVAGADLVEIRRHEDREREGSSSEDPAAG